MKIADLLTKRKNEQERTNYQPIMAENLNMQQDALRLKAQLHRLKGRLYEAYAEHLELVALQGEYQPLTEAEIPGFPRKNESQPQQAQDDELEPEGAAEGEEESKKGEATTQIVIPNRDPNNYQECLYLRCRVKSGYLNPKCQLARAMKRIGFEDRRFKCKVTIDNHLDPDCEYAQVLAAWFKAKATEEIRKLLRS